MDLPRRTCLAKPNVSTEHVYFLVAGFASVVTSVIHREPIEVGIIGREGFVNISVILGADRSPMEIYIQLPGSGYRVEAGILRAAVREDLELRDLLHRYAHAFMVQNASTVLANGQANVSERLARWLLMAQDRADGDQLDLTHEFLAMMLAVRRPSVTEALEAFSERHWISRERGRIFIKDRASLLVAANGYYGQAESELIRLFGAGVPVET